MTSSPAGYALARDVPLRPRNTFRIDARARWFATVRDAPSLSALLDERDVRDLPLLVLGQGSNVLFAEPWFEGLVVHLVCDGLRVLHDSPGEPATVQVEAAHDWDRLVDRTLQRGMRGLENLALIPGQVGAAPIQNIGAYGVEVGEFITAVLAFDRVTRAAVRLEPVDCEFGYRDSIFKREPDRRIVVAV